MQPDNNQNNQQNQPQSDKPQEKGFIQLITDFTHNFVGYAELAWHRLNNFEKTNIEIGVRQIKSGNLKDAVFRLKIAQRMNATNPITQYLLGKAYAYMGQEKKAVPHLKKSLELNPELGESKFLLSYCGVGEAPEKFPPSLLIESLDSMADIYNREIENGFLADLHELLDSEIKKVFAGKQGFDVLVLDCRVGKQAEGILDIANRIVGTEPSMNMMAIARQRRVGERLVFNEILNKTSDDFFTANQLKFGAIIATNSMTSYGNLQDIIRNISHNLQPGGACFFNVQKLDGEGYKFDLDKKTFLHSAKYIRDLVSQNSLEILLEKELVYPESGNEIFFTLKKNG